MKSIMGIDIGTTGCRAVVYGYDGSVFASFSEEYPMYTKQAAWSEQDPDQIFAASMRVAAKAVSQVKLQHHQITGICFSAVMHSIIPVDQDGNALHFMLTWADSRSQGAMEALKQQYSGEKIYEKTGCPPHPMYPLYKIKWFKDERPDLFARTVKFVGIKEYILYKMTGKYLLDKSLASATSIYNIHSQEWDGELLDLLGISPDLLPQVVPTTHIETGMFSSFAEQLGISQNTPIIMGASDGVLSTLGSGTVNVGQMTAMIGTSGAVRVVTDRPYSDEKRRTWCYNMTEDSWVLGGALSNGGIAFRWARDKFAATEQYVADKLGLDAYDLLGRYAEQKPAGSDGLIMLPLFSGERAPYYNANARGVLFGLNLNHGKRHIIRATLEGIIYRMYSIFQSLEEVSGKVHEIRATGSFTHSKLWVQIMADVFGHVIAVPGEPEGSAFGAAVLGMYALGDIKDIKEVTNFINIKTKFYPDKQNHELYQQLFAIYSRVYWNLQQEFDAISEIQRNLKNK